MNYKGEITPLLCEREAKLPLEGEFTLYALVSAEVANFVVSSKETIHKSLPVSHLKFKKKQQRKAFCSKSHSCSIPPLSLEVLSGSRLSFAGNLITSCKLSTVLSASEAAAHAGFSPPPSAL